jgi:hypothetical protein
VLPPVLRYLNANDPAMGLKKWHSQTSSRFTLPQLQHSVACLAM